MNLYDEKECQIMAKLEVDRIKYMYYHAKRKFQNYLRYYYKATDNGLLHSSYSNGMVENVADYWIDTKKNELSFVYNNVTGTVKLTPAVCKKIREVMEYA